MVASTITPPGLSQAPLPVDVPKQVVFQPCSNLRLGTKEGPQKTGTGERNGRFLRNVHLDAGGRWRAEVSRAPLAGATRSSYPAPPRGMESCTVDLSAWTRGQWPKRERNMSNGIWLRPLEKKSSSHKFLLEPTRENKHKIKNI